MSKYDACIASAYTSAGAFVVTTCGALLYGVCVSGSAAATFINVHQGVTTGGAKKLVADAPITAAGLTMVCPPIVCSGGIISTNIGTVATYCVLYVNNT